MTLLGLDVSGWIDGLGGLALLAFGCWVLTLRPRTSATLGLGVFAMGFGAGIGISYFGDVGLADVPTAWTTFTSALTIATIAIGGAALLMVAVSFPAPLREGRGRAVVLSLLASAPITVAGLVVDVASGDPDAGWTGVFIALAPWWAALFLLAWRYGVHAGDAERARSIALVTVALLLYPATASASMLSSEWGPAPIFTIASVAAVTALAALWLRAGARGGGPIPRNVALFALAWFLATMLVEMTTGGPGQNGVARALSVVVLAYAILRHQIFGLDVKARWTISKTTIAAVFIAVFFVASEAAQQFFGETLGSSYVGILAAGALVFAIAPLSRFADRIAARAVPGAARPSEQPAAQRAALYREHLLLAYRDGVVSRDERLHLELARRHLALTEAEAVALEREVVEASA